MNVNGRREDARNGKNIGRQPMLDQNLMVGGTRDSFTARKEENEARGDH